jgi:hypothetical protein
MEESYRKLDGLNQSLLKKILVSPTAFLQEKERMGKQETDKASHFVFGSLVDYMLVRDMNKFDDHYYIMSEDTAEPAMKPIIQYMYDTIITLGLDHEDPKNAIRITEIIAIGCTIYNWQPRWKMETKINKILKLGEPYYNALFQAKGRQIITPSEYDNAVICKASINADEYLSKYLTPTKTNTIVKGLVLQFEYRDIKFKGEIDKVYIDHSEKTIEPIDYKTTDQSVNMFKYNFWKFRYDIQATLYNIGVILHPKVEELLNKGYRMLPFKFIVVEKESINKPRRFQMEGSAITIGKIGGVHDGRYYEGLENAIDRYEWHMKNDKWEHPVEYYENNGIMEITV